MRKLTIAKDNLHSCQPVCQIVTGVVRICVFVIVSGLCANLRDIDITELLNGFLVHPYNLTLHDGEQNKSLLEENEKQNRTTLLAVDTHLTWYILILNCVSSLLAYESGKTLSFEEYTFQEKILHEYVILLSQENSLVVP